MQLIKKHENLIASILILIVAVLSVIPSLYICRYVYPVQDDFHYARYVREVMSEGNGLFVSSIKGTIDYYKTFCGCYSSSFLGFFVSGIVNCNIWGVRLVCLISVGLFYIALYFFLITMFGIVFGVKKHEARWLFLLVLECLTGIIYYAEHEDYYWFITAVQYLFITTCILAGSSLLIYGIIKKRKYLYIVSALLAVIGSGGALNIAALCVCTYGFIWIWAFFDSKERKNVSIVCMVALLFAVINGVAPGNYIRKGTPLTVNQAVQAILLSYKYMIDRYVFYLKNPLFIFVLITLLIALLFIKMPTKDNGYKLPIFMMLVLESTIALVIFPVMIGYGWDAYQVICRANFISDLVLFICTVISALYIKGWMNRIGVELKYPRYVGTILIILICIIAGFVLNKQWKKGTAMYRQYAEIKDKSMQEYSDYVVDVINQVKNSNDSIVRIYIPVVEDKTCLINAQYTIGEYDINEFCGNTSMANFYGKKAVYIYPVETKNE